MIFAAVQQEPEFPQGGDAGFKAFLAKIIDIPTIISGHGAIGSIEVTFVVEKDGSLTAIKTKSSTNHSVAEASEKAVAKSPLWIPGEQNGLPVRVQYSISFKYE